MGIIILPLWLAALAIGIVSLEKAISYRKDKLIGLKEGIGGLITSIIIFGLICLSYLIEDRFWGLGPAFRLPVFMVFVPYIIHFLIRKSKHPKLFFLSKILLVSIVCTLILGVVFYNVLFELMDYLGIQEYY